MSLGLKSMAIGSALSALRPDRSSSIADLVLDLPKRARDEWLSSLTPAELDELQYAWWFWARKNQLPPDGAWLVWLLMAGRGMGKTRSGAEWAIANAKAGLDRGALIGRTAGDVRDTMLFGESGIFTISRPDFMPKYEPTKRRITWPNGVRAFLYSSEKPDQLRGPQHRWLWAEEIAAWRYIEAWTNAMLGLRLPPDPRACVTTTPKPTKLMKELVERPNTIAVGGSTYENLSNLAPAFREEVLAMYEGTRLGRQELYGELLLDNPKALWQSAIIDYYRTAITPFLNRIVVGVDPRISENDEDEKTAETGIVVCGRAGRYGDPKAHLYVLDDLSIRAQPNEWGTQVISGYSKYEADRVIAEGNQGGAMVRAVIHSIAPGCPVDIVYARRAKQIRAEPIAALYEQGRAHHVGSFPDLERQMTEWEPGDDSPDRIDALVIAATALMVESPNVTQRVQLPDSARVRISPV